MYRVNSGRLARKASKRVLMKDWCWAGKCFWGVCIVKHIVVLQHALVSSGEHRVKCWKSLFFCLFRHFVLKPIFCQIGPEIFNFFFLIFIFLYCVIFSNLDTELEFSSNQALYAEDLISSIKCLFVWVSDGLRWSSGFNLDRYASFPFTCPRLGPPLW